MDQNFDGNNLRLARLANNLSLADIGDVVDKSKQFIQRLEAGRDMPTDDLAKKLANLLKVEVGFFCQSPGHSLPDRAYHFRKLIGTKVADRQSAIAKGELFRRVVSLIDSRLKLPAFNFPEYDISTPLAAERAAEQCRAYWGLGIGPIANMIRVIENAGGVVTSFEETGRGIDALSIASARPIVVMNSNEVSACRARFGYAHEIGHFIGHEGQQTGDKGLEAEANRFAGAFLMPRSTFCKEFPKLRGGTQINWLALAELKFRWGVSKAAMLYRARQLELITEDQYRRAIIGRLFAKGERNEEDEDRAIAHEQPELLLNAMRAMQNRLHISINDVARAVYMTKDLLIKIAPQISELDSLAKKQNHSSKVFSLSEYRSKESMSTLTKSA
ncbi:MAG: ImmA/IrrE family metallo-endopeptidase [Betaproteobacteria bacterium]|nr:ImmA/IrrE family metallo-endopeptidase [Betaproteobacteria bacterium]